MTVYRQNSPHFRECRVVLGDVLERVIGIHKIERLVGELKVGRISLLQRCARSVSRIEICMQVYSCRLSAELLREYCRLQPRAAPDHEYSLWPFRNAAPEDTCKHLGLAVTQPGGALPLTGECHRIVRSALPIRF